MGVEKLYTILQTDRALFCYFFLSLHVAGGRIIIIIQSHFRLILPLGVNHRVTFPNGVPVSKFMAQRQKGVCICVSLFTSFFVLFYVCKSN